MVMIQLLQRQLHKTALRRPYCHVQGGAARIRRSQPRSLISRRHANSNSKTNSATKKSSTTTTENDIPPLMVSLRSFGIGSLAGALGSMAGMGGGFVMIPLMTSSLLRLSQHQAHGTSLFAVTATGLSGAYAYQDHVHLPAALAIATTAMVTARWGALVTRWMTEKALKRALGVLLLVMGPAVPAKAHFMELQAKKKEQKQQQLHNSDDNDGDVPSALPTRRLSTIMTQSTSNSEMMVELWKCLKAPAAIGLGSGFLAGVFGVGGGTIVVPALSYAMDQEITTHHQALATSLAAMTLPAAVGTFTHIRVGNVALRVAPPLAVGALCGAYVGGKWAVQTNESVLRWGFSALLSVLGVRTLWKTR